MKKYVLIHLVYSENHDGKYYAHAETIRAGENLRPFINRYPHADIIHICHGATEAAYLAMTWNENYKNNGTLWEG